VKVSPRQVGGYRGQRCRVDGQSRTAVPVTSTVTQIGSCRTYQRCMESRSGA